MAKAKAREGASHGAGENIEPNQVPRSKSALLVTMQAEMEHMTSGHVHSLLSRDGEWIGRRRGREPSRSRGVRIPREQDLAKQSSQPIQTQQGPDFSH